MPIIRVNIELNMINEVFTNFALEAENLISNGLFDEAIQLCEKGLLCYPNYSAAMLVLTKAYLFKEDIDNACNTITKAHKLFPLNMAIVNVKNDIENRIKSTSEQIKTEEIENKNIENINSNDLIIEVEVPVSLAKDIIESEKIDNIKEIDENLAELEKIADLMKKISEGENIENITLLKASENISNTDNEFNEITDIIVENDIIDNEQDAENTIIVSNCDEIIDTNIIETSNIADNKHNIIDIDETQNCIDNELLKIDEVQQGNVKRLYEIDLELPRTIIDTQLDWYSSIHIPIDNNLIESHLFNDSLILVGLDDILNKNKVCNQLKSTGTAVDYRTQDILNIAEGLKNVAIPKIEEDEEVKEEFEIPIIASETMAKILVKQQKIQQAIKVYNMLIIEKPNKKEYFQEQINLLLN